jgi:hypothetical protein
MTAKTAPRYWRRDIGAKTFSRPLLPGRVVAGGRAPACHCHVMVVVAETIAAVFIAAVFIAAEVISPFVGNFSFICSRASNAGRTARRVKVRAFW